MKKITKSATVAILAVCMSLSLAACVQSEGAVSTAVSVSSEVGSVAAVVDEVVVAEVTLSETYVTLEAETTYDIAATVTGAEDITLMYVSSNPSVATVDENGKVTWASVGEADITVSGVNLTPVMLKVVCSAKPISDEVEIPSNSSSAPDASQAPNKPTSPQKPDAASSGVIENPSSKPDETVVPDVEDKDPTGTNSNGATEIDSSKDQSKWDAGVSVKLNSHYEPGFGWETVRADIQEAVKPYGHIVTEGGFIGNGSSIDAGNIRIDYANGEYKFYIYNWRKDITNQGLNPTINSALQVMKYFLGDTNGATLWSFWDAFMTGQKPNMADYGITDANLPGEMGALIFSDGSEVGFMNSDNYFMYVVG